MHDSHGVPSVCIIFVPARQDDAECAPLLLAMDTMAHTYMHSCFMQVLPGMRKMLVMVEHGDHGRGHAPVCKDIADSYSLRVSEPIERPFPDNRFAIWGILPMPLCGVALLRPLVILISVIELRRVEVSVDVVPLGVEF